MTAQKNYRKYQQLISKAKSRSISSGTDWEKIDRIEEQFRLKALEEIKLQEIITYPELSRGRYAFQEPIKRDFKLWELIRSCKFPKFNYKFLTSFLP